MTSIPVDLLEESIQFRRSIHRRPELSGEEIETRQKIVEALQSAGYTPKTFANHQGIVALWPGRDRTRAIAFRADLDALPLQEHSGKPWASEKPMIMHACGHDGHASILLAFAKWLARLGQTFAVDVAFIWQPAEETGQGAPALIADGVLQGPPCIETIYGFHGWPELAEGKIAVHRKAVMASVDNFDITFTGVGAHGAMPQLGKDPVVAAAHLITVAQSLVSRSIAPLQNGVVTFAHIEGGRTYNVIPERCHLKGTIRALDHGVRKTLREGLERMVTHVAETFSIGAKLHWVEGTPATVNHENEAKRVEQAVIESLGKDALVDIPPSMGGEDFSYFLEKVKGAYFWLGQGHVQGMLHNPRFDFNDETQATAMKVLFRILELEQLEQASIA